MWVLLLGRGWVSEVSLGVSLQELTTLFYLFNFFEIGSY